MVFILAPALVPSLSYHISRRTTLFQLPAFPSFQFAPQREEPPHSPKGQIYIVTSDISLPAQPTNYTLSSVFLIGISGALEVFTTFSECSFSEEMMVLSLHSSLLGISSSVSPRWPHTMSEVCSSIPSPYLGHLSVIFIHSLKINKESIYAFSTLHFLHCHIFPKNEKIYGQSSIFNTSVVPGSFQKKSQDT